jgi:hypothetical protein
MRDRLGAKATIFGEARAPAVIKSVGSFDGDHAAGSGDFPRRHIVGREDMLVASLYWAGDRYDGRQFVFLQIAHDRAPTDPKQLGRYTVASRTHLCNSCDVVAHAGHLWNSPHIANNSARRSATRQRAWKPRGTAYQRASERRLGYASGTVARSADDKRPPDPPPTL